MRRYAKPKIWALEVLRISLLFGEKENTPTHHSWCQSMNDYTGAVSRQSI